MVNNLISPVTRATPLIPSYYDSSSLHSLFSLFTFFYLILFFSYIIIFILFFKLDERRQENGWASKLANLDHPVLKLDASVARKDGKIPKCLRYHAVL